MNDYQVSCEVVAADTGDATGDVSTFLAQTSQENLVALAQAATREIEAGNNFTLKCTKSNEAQAELIAQM